ncbi:MAG: HEAT repeat domain-containing protein, partial [Chloroflexota bacterium]
LDALGICGAPEGIPVVRDAINDPDPDVKYAAVLSLFELAGVDALDDVLLILDAHTGATLAQILRAFFHATNYLKIDIIQDNPDRLLNVLDHAFKDTNPVTRMMAVYPLAWTRHEKATSRLMHAYNTETDSTVKAHIVRVSANLMSEVGEEMLEDAKQSTDAMVRETALHVIADRERAGVIATYDTDAHQGVPMNRDLLLGKYDINKPI